MIIFDYFIVWKTFHIFPYIWWVIKYCNKVFMCPVSLYYYLCVSYSLIMVVSQSFWTCYRPCNTIPFVISLQMMKATYNLRLTHRAVTMIWLLCSLSTFSSLEVTTLTRWMRISPLLDQMTDANSRSPCSLSTCHYQLYCWKLDLNHIWYALTKKTCACF